MGTQAASSAATAAACPRVSWAAGSCVPVPDVAEPDVAEQDALPVQDVVQLDVVEERVAAQQGVAAAQVAGAARCAEAWFADAPPVRVAVALPVVAGSESGAPGPVGRAVEGPVARGPAAVVRDALQARAAVGAAALVPAA